LLLDHRVRVENGGETVAPAYDAQRLLEERIRALAGELDIGAGLKQMHLIHDVQQDLRHLVGAVRAIPQQSADVDVGKVGIGSALGGGDANLGRGGVVVELDEEAFQQLAG
jgi:hypothetical protein